MDRLVVRMWGCMLFWGDGLVDMVYSANCGGMIEYNEYVWGGVFKVSLCGYVDGSRELGESTEVHVYDWVHGCFVVWCVKICFGSSNYCWIKCVLVEVVWRGLKK